jgi:hypothetical protein
MPVWVRRSPSSSRRARPPPRIRGCDFHPGCSAYGDEVPVPLGYRTGTSTTAFTWQPFVRGSLRRSTGSRRRRRDRPCRKSVQRPLGTTRPPPLSHRGSTNLFRDGHDLLGIRALIGNALTFFGAIASTEGAPSTQDTPVTERSDIMVRCVRKPYSQR